MEKESYKNIICIMVVFSLIFPAVFANSNESIQSDEAKTVSIYFESTDRNKNDLQDGKIAEITLKEAEQIKNQLLEIEENYEAEEKIRNQMRILHDHGLLSDEITFDNYLNVLNKVSDILPYNQFQTQQAEDNGFIFSGPSIESSLTIGGQTFQLQSLVGGILEYYFDIQLIDYQDNDTLNGTHFHSSAYSGPVFVGISPASAFVTTIGIIFSGPVFIYSPFVTIRVLFGGAHLSAKIYECVNPVTVFDWHVNAALMGVLVYQSSAIPDFGST